MKQGSHSATPLSVIERHWPDLRGLKQPKPTPRTKTIMLIERHWPDLRGLKHESQCLFQYGNS
mgnify:CR=1 FL=1